jgi:tetratricopeptide (TPR) repeat protein
MRAPAAHSPTEHLTGEHQACLQLADKARELATSLYRCGNQQHALSNFEVAISLYEQAYQGAANEEEAFCLGAKSRVLSDIGRCAEALQCASTAFAIERELAGSHIVTKGLANAHNWKGLALAKLGRNQEALTEFAKAIKIGAYAGEDFLGLANYLLNFSSALVVSRQYAPALQLFEHVIDKLATRTEPAARRATAVARSRREIALLRQKQASETASVAKTVSQRFAPMKRSSEDPADQPSERGQKRAKTDETAPPRHATKGQLDRRRVQFRVQPTRRH